MTFEEWWPTAFKFCFGTKWLEPIVREFAKTAYEVGKIHAQREALHERSNEY